MIKKFILFVFFLQMAHAQQAQDKFNADLLTHRWDAWWISPNNVSLTDYGVFYFRKSFDLQEIPEEFVINISADNRYKLFVNGKFVCLGPAKGDLSNWPFETVDISSYLKKGKNLLAAQVWNWGLDGPSAQLSHRTALIVQGNTKKEAIINTNDTWKWIKNEAYEPIPFGPMLEDRFYFVTGPGDRIDGNKNLWGWNQISFDDSAWKVPKPRGGASQDIGRPKGIRANSFWQLIPRNIPFMVHEKRFIGNIREKSDKIIIDKNNLNQLQLKIPENASVEIILDNNVLTTGYPELIFSGGKDASVKLTYAETFYHDDWTKGHRDSIQNKKMVGNYDVFICDGEDRMFTTLWYRTFRYVKISIETADSPLEINQIAYNYSAYPFEKKAEFSCSDPDFDNILETGWRTAELCAHETYMDCPYWEQMNYVGDTRIQALISYSMANDDRLARNAILHFANSMLPEGHVECRYPANLELVIPGFSMIWIAMVHDYWMYRDDNDFVNEQLNIVQNLLSYYDDKINKQGLIGELPYANFIGSVPHPKDMAVLGKKEESRTLNTLFYLYGLQSTIDLFNYFGKECLAEEYQKIADKLKQNIIKHCWDKEEGLFTDVPGKKQFSQHGNALAILCDLQDNQIQSEMLYTMLSHDDIVKCDLYFSFYLAKAMQKTGNGEKYYQILDIWKEALGLGLTTFPEYFDGDRSECHAWSAGPLYFYYSIIAGIMPNEPNFKSVVIQPAMGNLDFIEGVFPHPMGDISFNLKKDHKGELKGSIELPKELSGKFIWNKQEIELNSGYQKIGY